MEPILNQHLAVGRQNLDAVDLVQVMDNDLGVVEFLEVTKEDIQATGKLVPMGARHFARQNILNQNLFNLGNSALYQDPAVSVHMSGKQIAKLIESTLDLERFAVYRENVRIDEQLETQTLAQVAEQNVATTAGTTPEVIADGTEAPPEI